MIAEPGVAECLFTPVCTPAGANAIVVVAAGGVAASLMSYNINVISITDDITPGIPSFQPPVFSSPRANLSTTQVFEVSGSGD